MKSIVSYQALEDIRMEFLVLVINVMKKEQYQFQFRDCHLIRMQKI